jgi:hypothetical protein
MVLHPMICSPMHAGTTGRSGQRPAACMLAARVAAAGAAKGGLCVSAAGMLSMRRVHLPCLEGGDALAVTFVSGGGVLSKDRHAHAVPRLRAV